VNGRCGAKMVGVTETYGPGKTDCAGGLGTHETYLRLQPILPTTKVHNRRTRSSFLRIGVPPLLLSPLTIDKKVY
jgi:hypothetical protein